MNSTQKQTPKIPTKQSVPDSPQHHSSLSELLSDGSDEDRDGYEYEIEKLRRRVHELKKKESQLRLDVASLDNKVDFLQKKCNKSDDKNKQLIQKLSAQQVQNRRLNYVISQMQQEHNEANRQYESTKTELNNIQGIHAKMKENHTSLTVMLKTILDVINRAKTESIDRAVLKVREVLEKGVRFLDEDCQSSQVTLGNYNFGQSSDRRQDRNPRLEKENEQLKSSISTLKEQLQKEKSDKRRILPVYNEILNKLRQSCANLKFKVDQIYTRAERDKQSLEQLITQKQQLIDHLQTKNEELLELLRKSEERQKILAIQLAGNTLRNSRLQQSEFQPTQSLALQELEYPPSANRQKKPSFIGDWKKKTKLKKELENIDDEIQIIIEQIQYAQN